MISRGVSRTERPARITYVYILDPQAKGSELMKLHNSSKVAKAMSFDLPPPRLPEKEKMKRVSSETIPDTNFQHEDAANQPHENQFNPSKKKTTEEQMNKLNNFVNEDQIAALNNIKTREWSPEAIIKALKFRFGLGVHGYEFLRNTNHPLPGYSTLTRRLRELEFNFGIFKELKIPLASKVDKLDRFCILSIDEMYINDSRGINKNKMKFSGGVTLGPSTDKAGGNNINDTKDTVPLQEKYSELDLYSLNLIYNIGGSTVNACIKKCCSSCKMVLLEDGNDNESVSIKKCKRLLSHLQWEVSRTACPTRTYLLHLSIELQIRTEGRRQNLFDNTKPHILYRRGNHSCKVMIKMKTVMQHVKK
ncbi:hypothetical protein ACI65C_004536 [Semiaphis heraclei]